MSYYDKYIIKKDYYIYKNLDINDKINFYSNDNTNLYRYGSLIDSLLKSLTAYEREKLRLLAFYINGQGISSLSPSELVSLVDIATNPQYDSLIKSLGVQSQLKNKNSPNPAKIITQIKNDKIEEEETANPIIEKFLSDIRNVPVGYSYRGWMLPNGELLSQFDDSFDDKKGYRQDHSNLYKIFIRGVKEYDKDAYDKIIDLYTAYMNARSFPAYFDHDESFAVEALGWCQIAVNGGHNILCRAERWQNRLLRPLIENYGFRIEISEFGDCHYAEFSYLYDHIDEIIKLGLEEKYGLHNS